MGNKPNLARTLVVAVIGVAIIIFVQYKFKAVTKIMDKISGKKSEEVKPAQKDAEGKDLKEGEKKEGEAEAQEPVSVKVVKAQKADFQDLLPVLGSIEGTAEVDLKFEVAGIIDFFNFKEGERVRKGDVVSRLDNKDALLKVKYRKAKLEVARTAMDSAQNKLKIYQNLYDIGAIIKDKLVETQLEFENKSKEYDAAKIEVESAKQELSKTYLKSPIDGLLGPRDAEPGEYVSSNNDVVSVLDTSEVNAKIGIVEKDIDAVRVGQPCKFFVDTYPNKTYDGELLSITPMIKGKSRTLTVKVKIPNNDEAAVLVPGMFTRGFVTVYTKQDTFAIPIKAIEGSGEETSVFVVDEKNIAHQRAVKIGYTTIDEAQIDEGLAEGDMIITDTPIKLKEGAPVKVTEEEQGSGEAPVGVGAEVGEKE